MSSAFGIERLLEAYRAGIFPMAERFDDPTIYLVDPEERGILPLDHFHIPRRLKKTLRKTPYHITFDQAFETIIKACASKSDTRLNTWINAGLIGLYSELHHAGYAHSVECWQDGQLVGGLYGVSLGGAFFGESMFSKQADASKIALVYLVGCLKLGGYSLLDAQFTNPHLEQFGLIEIPRAAFKERLAIALEQKGFFYPASVPSNGAELIHLITQTS